LEMACAQGRRVRDARAESTFPSNL
jgi:hypothetical protein